MDKEIRGTVANQTPDATNNRAVVIIPPVCDFYFTPHRFSCLGPSIVAQILCRHGFDADILNFPLLEKKGRRINIPNALSYLQPFVHSAETGRMSFFTKYQRFGADPAQCAAVAVARDPALYFVNCFAYSYSQEAIAVAIEIKKIKPNAIIVAGGAGVSAYPLHFIQNSAVDFALTGEAEVSLPLFLQAFSKRNLPYDKVPNLYWKENGTVRLPQVFAQTAEPDIIPALSKVNERHNADFYSMSLSRGCKKTCRFCSNFLVHGRMFRKASINTVADTIRCLDCEISKRIIINFEDDNLLYDSDYFLSIMKLFRNRFSNVSFVAENGIDYNLLTFDLADKLIAAGLSGFNFTFATTNAGVLAQQDRDGSTQHFESIVRHIAKQNIPVLSYFICGLAGDTKESAAHTLAYLSTLPTQVGISMFYAIPNLPDFTDMTIFDKLPACVCNGSSAYPWNKTLSTKELITAFRLSRFVNLVKDEKKNEIEKELTDKIAYERKLYTLIKDNGKIKIIDVPEIDTEMVELFFKNLP